MVSKKRNSIPKKNLHSTKWHKFNRSEWQVIVPAFIIFSWGLLSLIAGMIGGHLFTPGENVVALLLLALGVLAIFQVIRRETISNFARIVIWSLAIIATLVTIFWVGGSNEGSCIGLMNEQVSCTDSNRFMITVLFRNPFSLAVAAIIVISGIINILTSSNKSRIK